MQATSGMAEWLPYMEWLCFQSPFSLWLVLWQPHIYQRDNWQLHTLLVVKFISKEYLFSMRACLNLSLLFILEAFPFCFVDYTISHIFFWMPRAFVFITGSWKKSDVHPAAMLIIANGYAKHQNFSLCFVVKIKGIFANNETSSRKLSMEIQHK